MMGTWTILTLLLQVLLLLAFLWMFGLPAIIRYQKKQVVLVEDQDFWKKLGILSQPRGGGSANPNFF